MEVIPDNIQIPTQIEDHLKLYFSEQYYHENDNILLEQNLITQTYEGVEEDLKQINLKPCASNNESSDKNNSFRINLR